MSVQELIIKLQSIEDKTLDVGILTEEENLWVRDLEVANTGEPGHENFGAVYLEVSE